MHTGTSTQTLKHSGDTWSHNNTPINVKHQTTICFTFLTTEQHEIIILGRHPGHQERQRREEGGGRVLKTVNRTQA